MIDRSIEQVLQEVGFIVTNFKGTSMNPLLKCERDKVFIEKPKKRLEKYDVALYKRSNGMYVLHRVYKVMPSSYIFWGDNQLVLEFGVKDEDVLGVCKGFYKGERFVDFEKGLRYGLYKFFWCSSLRLRKFFNLFRRVGKKIKRIFSKKN